MNFVEIKRQNMEKRRRYHTFCAQHAGSCDVWSA